MSRVAKLAAARALVAALAFVALAVGAVALTRRGTRADAAPPTYSRDIAPMLFAHCATCHRPGESAPFPLLTYENARKRAAQIAEVTASGFMPPWLPEPGSGPFVGERRLAGAQIALFKRWADAFAPEGDRADLPPLPAWTEGWQLGEPDVLVTMDEPYTLPAGGGDVFRNFVLPVPIDATRWVRAVELRPGNKRVVHHAIVMVDPTRRSRRLDGGEPGPGFEGMDAVHGQAPDGHFIGWTPGQVPDAGGDAIAWRLDPGTDLVLQLHMLPSGKPETIRPSVGLYLGEAPRGPERTYTLYMKAADVDIPAGASDYAASETFVLPVDVQVERVYPHAHYLGKSIVATAKRPDGSSVPLIRIDEWDFNWQDAYRCVDPVPLPAGTSITMRWVFDNSEANVRNPSSPPVRVVNGNRTTDEMAHLYLQVRVADEGSLHALAIADTEHRLERTPGDWGLHTSLAGTLQAAGQLQAAMMHCRRALALKADYAPAHYCLGLIFERQGLLTDAARAYGQAAASEPDNPLMRVTLAEMLVKLGRLDDAEREIAQALEIDPALADAHTLLGTIRRLQGRLDEAMGHYAEAVSLRSGDVMAHTCMGVIRTQQGRFDEAAVHLRDALAIAPDNAVLHNSLGRVLMASGDTAGAAGHFQRAIEIEPGFTEARQRLEEALRGGR